MKVKSALVLLIFLISASAMPRAQTSGTAPEVASSNEDLQKATQNPVASLISVPVQNNTNFGIGPYSP